MNKKSLISLLCAAVLVVSLTGCSEKADATMAIEAAYEEAAVYDVTTFAAAGSTRSAANDSSISLPENRKWVITMSFSAETENLDESVQSILAQTQALEGYAESQSITGSTSGTQRRYAYLTLRIPAEKIDSFTQALTESTNITRSSRQVEDITLSYSDTQGRVTALETEQARLLELMEQAENMTDLLEIEERLTEVRYQLETYASRLRLYDNQVDYATLDVTLTEVSKFTPVQKQSFWQRISSGLAESMKDLGQFFVDSAAMLIIYLPYWVLGGILCLLISIPLRRILRKRKVKKQKT